MDAATSSEQMVSAEEAQPSRRRFLRLFLLVLLVIAAGFALMWAIGWWSHGRFVESTNDAYLRADFAVISPKVAGYVASVPVEENQPVKRGQLLITLDQVDYRAAAAQASAQQELATASIAGAEAAIAEQQATIAGARAALAAARSAAAAAAQNAARYAPLGASGAEPAEKVDAVMLERRRTAAAADAAAAALAAAERRTALLQAQREQGRAQQAVALAQRQRADADLSSVAIRSSIDGVVVDRSVRAGQFVQPATRLMTVVPLSDLYLIANFKETQVGAMRIGQPADIAVDALPGVVLHGTIESFAPGTGAQFSLLPPENATGNFTKIVQRVPVRIRIQAGPEARAVLRPGLSVHAAVDTSSARDAYGRIRDEARRLAERPQR